MKDRKPQNSALLIATLGVYLGLVLAGAAPQVLANAALSKQFNVRDEIEFKDDLDNKPDDCDLSQLRDKITDYETKFLWFNDRSIGEYTHFLEDFMDAYPEKVDGIDVSWRPVGEPRPWRKVVSKIAYPFGFLDSEKSEELDRDVLLLGNGMPGKAFDFSVLRNSFGTQFRFESKQVPYDAPLVRALYSSALTFYKCSEGGTASDDLLLKNTELLVERDHLVITTRLPRGSLDALLANGK